MNVDSYLLNKSDYSLNEDALFGSHRQVRAIAATNFTKESSEDKEVESSKKIYQRTNIYNPGKRKTRVVKRVCHTQNSNPLYLPFSMESSQSIFENEYGRNGRNGYPDYESLESEYAKLKFELARAMAKRDSTTYKNKKMSNEIRKLRETKAFNIEKDRITSVLTKELVTLTNLTEEFENVRHYLHKAMNELNETIDKHTAMSQPFLNELSKLENLRLKEKKSQIDIKDLQQENVELASKRASTTFKIRKLNEKKAQLNERMNLLSTNVQQMKIQKSG